MNKCNAFLTEVTFLLNNAIFFAIINLFERVTCNVRSMCDQKNSRNDPPRHFTLQGMNV